MTMITELKQFEIATVAGSGNWASLTTKAGLAFGAATIFTKLCSPLVTIAPENISTGGAVTVLPILASEILAITVKSTIGYLLAEDFFSAIDYWRK